MQKELSLSHKKSVSNTSGPGSLTTKERANLDLSKRIKGWGADLDLDVRPGVPMDKAPQLGVEDLYPAIEPQHTQFRVHKSSEHMKMPPVFGNVCPPKGLSGQIRNHAFRFSEGQSRHWVYLVLADRVDMIEVLLGDLLRLEIPNIPKEMGAGAVFKYNKKAVLKWSAVAVGAIALGALVAKSAKAPRLRA